MQIIKTTENDYRTPAVVTKEEWKQILSNNELMKRNYTDSLIAFYLENGHESTCKNLSEKYNKHSNFFNASISQFAKHVQLHLNRFEIQDKDGNSIYWRIVMTGRYNANGLFVWTLRDEIVEAMEELDFIKDNIDDMEITLSNNQVSYTWIPTFKAVSQWLVDFEDRQEELVDILANIGIDKGFEDEVTEGNRTKLTEIDPFTFFAAFMKFGAVRRRHHFKKLIEMHHIEAPIPEDFDGVPTAQAMSVWFFPYKYRRSEQSIPLLWKLFKQIMNDEVDANLFNSTLEIPGTGFTKLTQSLFYLKPESYLPVDSQTKPWLKANNIEIPDNWEDYQRALEQVRATSNKPFYQISHEAWLANQTDKEISTVASITNDYQLENKENEPAPIPLNRILYGPPGTGKTYTTTEFAVECFDPQWYQTWQKSSLYELEKRQQIKNKYDELVNKGRIAFTTFHQSFAYEDFVEGIRAETNENTNHLTYSIKEGVFKDIVNEANEVKATHKVSGLSDQPKIWKLSIGEVSEKTFRDSCIARGEARIGWPELGDLKLNLNERNQAQQNYFNERGSQDKSSIEDFAYNMSIGDVILCLKSVTSIQAVGIITSDYYYDETQALGEEYVHTRNVDWILKDIDLDILSLNDNIQITQKTCYQLTRFNWNDLVEELSKQGLSLDRDIKIYDDSSHPNALNYMIIIDEINRGNISRIFGELITLLEPDKRKGGSDAREVILPYSKQRFSVPSNLYVLGTMNTADKSLAQIDFALRRRFEFIELLPNPNLLADIEIFGVNVSDLLKIMNQRIEVLLDREHTIGHAYFWSLKDLESDDALEIELANIFKNRIIPLLQEYFFSDWERIGWVLNDPAKKPEHRFIQVDNLQPEVTELFHSSVTDQIMDRRYRINPEAFKSSKAYTGIIAVATQAD